MLFFWNFLLRVGLEQNGTEWKFLFSIFLILFQPILAWNEPIMAFLLIFQFFCYFFGIFYFASGRNETERLFFYSLFLGIFQPISGWNDATPVFLNFLNFFCYFFEIFSYAYGRNRTERNENFYFLSFSSFSNLFSLEMKP